VFVRDMQVICSTVTLCSLFIHLCFYFPCSLHAWEESHPPHHPIPILPRPLSWGGKLEGWNAAGCVKSVSVAV
jgi:hypothetical protein